MRAHGGRPPPRSVQRRRQERAPARGCSAIRSQARGGAKGSAGAPYDKGLGRPRPKDPHEAGSARIPGRTGCTAALRA